MANDHIYDYQIMAASKVIIRQDNKILFTREPLDNSWMPGRVGLPGGKYYLNEGIMDGTKRKITNEAGVNCEIKGLLKIVQILMPQKTVYHFIFVADYVSEDKEAKNTYSAGLEWLTRDQALALTKDDLTEYYTPQVLKEYYANPNKLIPLETIIELESFKDTEILSWMNKGNKKT